jgi:hypothetical protein
MGASSCCCGALVDALAAVVAAGGCAPLAAAAGAWSEVARPRSPEGAEPSVLRAPRFTTKPGGATSMAQPARLSVKTSHACGMYCGTTKQASNGVPRCCSCGVDAGAQQQARTQHSAHQTATNWLQSQAGNDVLQLVAWGRQGLSLLLNAGVRGRKAPYSRWARCNALR